MEPHQVQSQESQDAAIQQLYSMLCSPSLSRFAAESKNYVPVDHDAGAEEASTSHYQTRSRSSAPFSPPRTAVTRLGHTYHVTDPDFEHQQQVQGQTRRMTRSQEEADHDAPVIHIPDSAVAGYGAATQDSDTSAADEEYVHFIEQLQTGTDNLLSKPSDDKKGDPTFYLKKKDDEESKDEYLKRVSAKEILELQKELQLNPMPGLNLPLQVSEEPPIVTRSAARCRSSDNQGCSPSPAASPMKSPTIHVPAPYQVLDSFYSTPDELHAIAARTRGQIGKSPQKSFATPITSAPEPFKKPLPVGELHGKRQKVAQQTSRNVVAFPAVSAPEPDTFTVSMPPDIRERFKMVGMKYTRLTLNNAFTAEEKLFVAHMIDKAINKYPVQESVILAEYVVRIVELVSGERSIAQVQPFFAEAKKVDHAFTCLVLGVLVTDESPLILELAPILYGKTRLMKSVWKETRVAAGRPDEQESLIKTFRTAMKMNDRPSGMPKVDLTSSVAVRLGITGKEGLIDERILDFVEQELIYNPEEEYAETTLADRLNRNSTSKEPARAAVILDETAAKFSHQVTSDPRNLHLDFSHGMEGQSDGSNSSMHTFTPNLDAAGHSIGMLAPGQSVRSQAGLPDRSVQVFDMSAISEPAQPRRVQLITTALTASPLKNAQFESDSRKKSLRSALRLPTF